MSISRLNLSRNKYSWTVLDITNQYFFGEKSKSMYFINFYISLILQ